ncbi:MAG: hypothetical protein ABIC95_07055 [archaeon]
MPDESSESVHEGDEPAADNGPKGETIDALVDGDGTEVEASSGTSYASEADKYDSDDSVEEKEYQRSDEKGTRTIHGAVMIIEYTDPDTGEVTYVFERKPDDYAIEEFRDWLSLLGGGIDTTDAENLEKVLASDDTELIIGALRAASEYTIRREVSEEVASKSAQSILLKALDEQDSYFRHNKVSIPEGESYTFFYVVKIADKGEFETLKASGFTDDAGDLVPLTKREAASLGPKGYAFDHGDILFDYLSSSKSAAMSAHVSSEIKAPSASASIHPIRPATSVKPLEAMVQPYQINALRYAA